MNIQNLDQFGVIMSYSIYSAALLAFRPRFPRVGTSQGTDCPVCSQVDLYRLSPHHHSRVTSTIDSLVRGFLVCWLPFFRLCFGDVPSHRILNPQNPEDKIIDQESQEEANSIRPLYVTSERSDFPGFSIVFQRNPCVSRGASTLL